MDLLQLMVQENQFTGAMVRMADCGGVDVKFQKLFRNDAIIAYLSAFERLLGGLSSERGVLGS